MIDALDIQVKGIVQGVGFRPFVYRLARRYLVSGWVLNSREGVFIHAEAESKLLDEFVTELHMNPPAAARITELELKKVPLQDCEGFEIRTSDDAQVEETTLVSADLATCDDCLYELFDPKNRRYRYPFINCTNCGPRFTIIDSLPYDRPSTSMAAFTMCPDCSREYADPANRRFHAQPDACWECGPQVSLFFRKAKEADAADSPGTPSSPLCAFPHVQSTLGRAAVLSDVPGESSLTLLQPATLVQQGGLSPTLHGQGHSSGVEPGRETLGTVPAVAPSDWQAAWGTTREASDAIFATVVQLLADGGIVAVKGLGGFHLACDATNAQALATLRARKHRDGKAFAVMAPSVDAARRICHVGEAEAELLMSPARPIVLLRKLSDVELAPGLADALPEVGVMLPSTPVQHLLMHDFQQATGKDLLVMTSGNVHDEPIVTDDAQALEKLGGIADAILGNNRPIRARYDDSVVRVVQVGVDEQGNPNEALQFVRRARGYAPVPLAIPGDEQAAAVLAAGPEQKNTFTYAQGAQAFVSQHAGDLEDADTYDAWQESRERYRQLFQIEPQVLACDLHPEYLASKWAREQARREGLPLVEVQHHHAHVASVLGEHNLQDAAIGIAFDGTGYGPDGAIWGGEVLLANQADYERFANFSYVPMPGGAAAIRNPLRMAYGLLWACDLLEHPGARRALDELGDDQANLCAQMIERGINTPYTSSAGRLFDAVSALLGVCTQPTYEGEAAILLDAVRAKWDKEPGSLSHFGSSGWPAPDVCARYAVTFAKNAATPESTAHDTSVLLMDVQPTVRAVLDDLVAGVPVPQISLRFHAAMVQAIVHACELVRALYDVSLVALSGGCFMNRFLVEESSRALGEAGFTVALNANLPPNDGCISYGQAVVARAAR